MRGREGRTEIIEEVLGFRLFVGIDVINLCILRNVNNEEQSDGLGRLGIDVQSR